MHLAAIRLHKFDPYYFSIILENVSKFVDNFLFVVSDATLPELLVIATNNPKTLDIKKDSAKWSNGVSLDRLFRFVDTVAPETVLYTDQDELLPIQLPAIQDALMRSPGDIAVFRYLRCWDGINTIVVENCRQGVHGKLLKWHKGIRFVDSQQRYRGCCLPHDLKIGTVSAYPLRHLCYITESLRHQRLSSRLSTTGDALLLRQQNTIVQFDASLTYKEWQVKFHFILNKGR